MDWRSIYQSLSAEIVRLWFCPHVHRHDEADGFLVHCFCLHCRERWDVPFYAYREPKGTQKR